MILWYYIGRKNKGGDKMKPDKNLVTAYKKGISLQDESWEDIIYQEMVPDSYFLDDELYLFFSAGYYRLPMPSWVKGWRYGEVPASGRSTNFRDGHAEAGVSAMEVTKHGETYSTQDEVSAMFLTGEVIEIEGWLHYKRGSDGEPLLVACRELIKNKKGE